MTKCGLATSAIQPPSFHRVKWELLCCVSCLHQMSLEIYKIISSLIMKISMVQTGHFCCLVKKVEDKRYIEDRLELVYPIDKFFQGRFRAMRQKISRTTRPFFTSNCIVYIHYIEVFRAFHNHHVAWWESCGASHTSTPPNIIRKSQSRLQITTNFIDFDKALLQAYLFQGWSTWLWMIHQKCESSTDVYFGQVR